MRWMDFRILFFCFLSLLSLFSCQLLPSNIPNIWGDGELFAFSGLDGPTDSTTNFVFTGTANGSTLKIQSESDDYFIVEFNEAIQKKETKVATGDVLWYALETSSTNSNLIITFSAWNKLVGEYPANLVSLSLSNDKSLSSIFSDCYTLERWTHVISLALDKKNGKFALVYYEGFNPYDACNEAKQTLQNISISTIVEDRLAVYHKLPTLSDASLDRLLKKCFSVMKVNTLQKQDLIKQKWSTPDRVPHKYMWLWDTVFHSFGMNHVYPEVAWDFIKSVLDFETQNGYVAGEFQPNGPSFDGKTQPPLLSWAVWENYLHIKDISRLQYALPKLENYVEWDCSNRDSNHNLLLEWKVENSNHQHCTESGMDNSPRFDIVETLDAIDFSVYIALEMMYISKIAAAVGNQTKSKIWKEKSLAVSSKIHHLMWDQNTQFYYDRTMSGNLTFVQAVSGFFPLLLDDIPQERIPHLLKSLNNSKSFKSIFGVPSVSMSEKSYSTDMWRGPLWVNCNFFIIHGLQKYNYLTEADGLKSQTIAAVQKYYEQYGMIFEFYDSMDKVPPTQVLRKGRATGSIRDYHWSSALAFHLLFPVK